MKTPEKKKKSIWKTIGIIFLIALIGSVILEGTKSEEEKSNEALVKKQNDSLNAAYLDAKSILKSGLKDPDSFEEKDHKSFFVKKGSMADPNVHIQVKIKYRATNSFGAYIQNAQCFNYSQDLLMFQTYECQ